MVQRAEDGEKIVNPLIEEKVLFSVMKKFIGSKASDPEVTKWFKVEGGKDFLATTLGSAVGIFFYNKYDGKDDSVKYIKPLAKGEKEEVEAIPELEILKEGNKKITKLTGKTIEFPDVKGLFDCFDLSSFTEIDIPIEDIDEFISVHEAMSKVSKVGGTYNTANIVIASSERMLVKLYDSPLMIDWNYKFKCDVDDDLHLMNYHYDFEYMISIFKSLKDLKTEGIKLYLKDKDSPIFVVGKTVDYLFKFALNRKLTN